tara:strand:- start:3517 stop:3888 length:372 start_codon:yes stop_codon:yes gene_type:complete
MPRITRNDPASARQHIDALNEELAEFRLRKKRIKSRYDSSFTDTGAITREGLEQELLRLDILRRGEDPVDTPAQSLIQGQQNEVLHLLQLEPTMLDEKVNILERIRELEQQVQDQLRALQKKE